jgi:hypothetical protein
MQKAESRNHIHVEVRVNATKHPFIGTMYLRVVLMLNLNVELMLNSCYCIREFLVFPA